MQGHQGQPWGPAAQRPCSPASRGSGTRWATTGALRCPSCGKVWWARKGKEGPTKLGWAEPTTTARPWCSGNHPGHHTGTHATRVKHNGVHPTRRSTCHPQPSRSAPCTCATHGVVECREWTAGTTRRGVGHLGLTHTETHVVDDRRAEVRGQRKPSNDPPQQPAQPRYTNYWAERGNEASRSTGRSGRQNAATRHSMQREERVTIQGPLKIQQPDGMSHGGGVSGEMAGKSASSLQSLIIILLAPS